MRRKNYAAIDLHSRHSVIGWMSSRGEFLGQQRFVTSEDNLVGWTRSVPAREVTLTIEAGPLTRWAADILRPHVARLVICDPRYNRLVSHSSKKSDEVDVEVLCELLRLDALHEVWTGRDEDRLAFRCAAYELIKFRDQQRELKSHIKTRYRGAGILALNGRELFHPVKREHWIELMPEARRHGLLLLYDLFDAAYGAWSEQLAEVTRLGRRYPEIEGFMEVPGIGEVGAHLFSAIIEDPHRFANARQLYRFCALGITSRTSDGKPLGYERIDRSGRQGTRLYDVLAVLSCLGETLWLRLVPDARLRVGLGVEKEVPCLVQVVGYPAVAGPIHIQCITNNEIELRHGDRTLPRTRRP